jgi:protein disulfide isomerase
MRFAYSVEDDVREAMKASSGCAVYVYKPPRFISDKYDSKRARYPGKKLDETGLTKFMQQKSLPLVAQKTWKSNDRYDKAGLPVLTLFTKVDLEKNPKGYDYYANRLRRVASDEQFKGKLNFNVGDKEDFSYLLEDYELDLPEKKDVGVGIKDGPDHYHMTETFSVDHIKAFVASYLAGELTPKVKEEPDHSSDSHDDEDEDDDGTPSSVVTLTTDNFEEEITNAEVDAMLEFYAPWCGHCKKLDPEYSKLAKKVKKEELDDLLTIAKIDGTSNDSPIESVDWTGFPTLYFAKAGSNEATVYDGERTAKGLWKYIKKHATKAQEIRERIDKRKGGNKKGDEL